MSVREMRKSFVEKKNDVGEGWNSIHYDWLEIMGISAESFLICSSAYLNV